MANQPEDFQPLDPGRVNAADPAELKYWCRELDCTEAELQDALSKVGEHLTAVRDQLGSPGGKE